MRIKGEKRIRERERKRREGIASVSLLCFKNGKKKVISDRKYVKTKRTSSRCTRQEGERERRRVCFTI